MLHQFAPRLATQARTLFQKGALGAFPRHPVFFSTSARHFKNAPSGTTIVEETKSTTSASEVNEPEPTPTNLDNPPETVSCTVGPPSTYAFLKPTPVVLLTGPFGGNWCFRDTWQANLADQGYQSTSIELSMPHQELDSGDAYIRHFVKLLKTSIETDHSFYPPILIAHGLHALVAQKYVESNPVSALVLVSPFIPGIIKGRFNKLSYKLRNKTLAAADAAVVSSESSEPAPGEETVKSDSLSHQQETAAAAATETTTALTELQEFDFKTHADVVAQEGFREEYVLPAKAVYRIDRVAKEMQEKEKKREEKEKQERRIKEQEQAAKEEKEHEQDIETSKEDKPLSMESAAVETLGTDSVLDGGSTTIDGEKLEGSVDSAEDALPIQTVESEASIHSTLEQLPLSIYDTIPTSMFEPNFPILLVTSNGDEIVSTADVRDHHSLSGQVDHIELEDEDDGGHLVMVSDNAEWEQGIRGITAWLDSNGM
ncbi:hypothetical protein BG011_007900 [Mortierella polycephala]|uniref:Uncharacterized protein n=1 Tax=Mortierella polycephala TaxID=41804 RepID=A0A9P6PQQ6_9FUNG|nr:hypothetical protein BG011_007900 [Mortierella polycephala]